MNNMGMGGRGRGASGYQDNWNFQSNVDPEELFRKIFGDAGFKVLNQSKTVKKDFYINGIKFTIYIKY